MKISFDNVISKVKNEFKKEDYSTYTQEKLIKKIKFYKRFFMWISLAIIIPYGFYVGVGFCRNIATSGDKAKYIQDMKKLLSYDYSSTKADLSLPHNQLKDFSLSKDVFTFKNTGSLNSQDGMCLGFTIVEKLNYTNTLKDKTIKFNNKTIKFDKKLDLGSIVFSPDDIKKIYKGSTSSDVNYTDKIGAVPNRSCDILYDMNSSHSILDDFSDSISNKQISDLFNAANYFQTHSNEVTPKYSVEPYIYPSRDNASGGVIINVASVFSKNKVYSSFFPNLITDKIDKNEPVVFSISTPASGHAVLGYKYEYIDKNTFKVYVADSNFPLIRNAENKNKDIVSQLNHDIENNVFVIFKRDDNQSRWQFFYNPKLLNNYTYRGAFNSFIPNCNLQIQ